MKTTLVYLAGCFTPLVLLFFAKLWELFGDWKDGRRYQRAWDKFTAEFEALSPEALADYQKKWDSEPYRYAHYSCDRDRYFSMKWQYGRTTEV